MRPWESIGMDFIGAFPEVNRYNYLWVVICRMTSMVHVVPVHMKMTVSQYMYNKSTITWIAIFNHM